MSVIAHERVWIYSLTLGAMPICERPSRVLEPAKAEIVPVESTEMKITAFIM
jgi:hypothetical protein